MRVKIPLLCVLVLCMVLSTFSAFAAVRYQALVDPSFENQDARWIGAYWGGMSETVAATPANPARTGNYMRYLHGVAGPRNVVEQGIGTGGIPAIPPGAIVHAGAWIKCLDASATNPCEVRVRPRPDNGQGGTTYTQILTTPDWTFVGDDGTGEGFAMPGGTWLAFRIYGPDQIADGSGVVTQTSDRPIYVDDCQCLVDAYAITGRVVDQTGTPVPGATVSMNVAGSTTPVTTTTDAAGKYTFAVGPGTYGLEAYKPNYDAGYGTATLVDQDVVASDLVMTALDTSVISGKVLNGATGVAGVELSFAYQTSDLFTVNAVNATSGPDGSYSAEVINNSYVYVGMRKLGYKVVDMSQMEIIVLDDVSLNINVVTSGPLVDVSADDAGVTGAVGAWTNHGSLGGTFKFTDASRVPNAMKIAGYNAVQFSDDRLRLVDATDTFIPMPAECTGAGSWTVAGWYYVPSVPGWNVYFCWAPHGDLSGGNINGSASAMYGNEGNSGAFYNRGVGNLAWNTVPAAGVWHHLAVSYDGAVIRAFVDGAVQQRTALGQLSIINGSPIHIGARYWNLDGSTNGDYFNGAIARLQFFGSSATAADIPALMASTQPVQQATYKISGHVTDLNGGAPIEGASVSIRIAGTMIDAVTPVTTDASGYYEASVAAGTYNVYAWKTSYMTSKKVADVSNSAVVADHQLGSATAGPVISVDAADATSAGWTNHGLYGGSFTAVSGNIGTSLIGPDGAQRLGVVFDGSQWLHLTKDGAWVPAGNEITGQQPHTVIAWVYDPLPTSNDSWRDCYISWAPQGNAPRNGMYLGLGWQVWGSAVCGFDAGSTPTINWTGSNSTFETSLAESTAPWGRWAQVVTVYDGTAYKIYVDGVERTDMAKTYSTNTAPGYHIYLGGAGANGTENPGRWGDSTFTGTIARLKMYAYALDQAAISADFADAPPVIVPVVLSGKVLQAGSPVAGATVVLYKKTSTGAYDIVPPAVDAASDGSYSFSVLPGDYRVVAFLGSKLGSLDVKVTVAKPNQDITLVDQGSAALINVKSNNLPMGNLSAWPNLGTAGGQFNSTQVATPVVQEVGGHKAVSFNGNSRMQSDFLTPLLLTKKTSFTASAWVYTAGTPVGEETIISWAPMWVGSGAYSFWLNYGSDTGWGLVDWGDMGMGTASIPASGAWHNIAISYNNDTDSAVVYVDNVVAASAVIDANLVMGGKVSIGSGYDAAGAPIVADWGTLFTGSIASIEVYPVAMNAAGIVSMFNNPPWASVVAENVANITALKGKAVGTPVKLTGNATVTYAPRNASNARSTSFFYIGEKQGLGGLRVVDKTSDSLNIGDTVTGLTGTVKKTAAGEIYLELSADPTGTAGAAIPAIGLNNKSVATDAKAQTNAVRVWGKATYSGGTTFTITDGYSSTVTVQVNGVALPAVLNAKTAVVTGVVSKDDTGKVVILAGSVKAF